MSMCLSMSVWMGLCMCTWTLWLWLMLHCSLSSCHCFTQKPFMKLRLFGDLETISTIGKGIMNASLFSLLSWPVFSYRRGLDALTLHVLAFYFIHKVYKVEHSELNKALNKWTDLQTNQQSVNSVLFLHFKMISLKKFVYICILMGSW